MSKPVLDLPGSELQESARRLGCGPRSEAEPREGGKGCAQIPDRDSVTGENAVRLVVLAGSRRL
eukprot:2270543-Rhodomonas_salina.1